MLKVILGSFRAFPIWTLAGLRAKRRPKSLCYTHIHTYPLKYFSTSGFHAYGLASCFVHVVNIIWIQSFYKERRLTFVSVIDSSDTWVSKIPQEWICQDVQNWVLHVSLKDPDIRVQDVPVENFEKVSGSELCQMNLDDFINLEPTYGEKYYHTLRHLNEEGNCICGREWVGCPGEGEFQYPLKWCKK